MSEARMSVVIFVVKVGVKATVEAEMEKGFPCGAVREDLPQMLKPIQTHLGFGMEIPPRLRTVAYPTATQRTLQKRYVVHL